MFFHSNNNANINSLIDNVPKWSDTFLKPCSKCCWIFKVCLTILGHYTLKDIKLMIALRILPNVALKVSKNRNVGCNT